MNNKRGDSLDIKNAKIKDGNNAIEVLKYHG